MTRRLFQTVGAALLGLASALCVGGSSQAQDSWYPAQSIYIAPYQSYYRSGPVYSSYYYGSPNFYRSYSVQPYYNYGTQMAYRSYYGPTYGYGGGYYGLPRAGYYAAPYGGGQVHVGRLRVGW